MSPLWMLPVVLIALIYVHDRHRHADRGTHGRIMYALTRAAGAFREFNAANIQLWEHYLRAQRPWEADWLHWVRSQEGWLLEGTILPPPTRPPRQSA